jgi:hypothetical protein
MMRAMMGDASGGTELLDQEGDAKKKPKEASAKTLAERVPDDAFAKANGDTWAN